MMSGTDRIGRTRTTTTTCADGWNAAAAAADSEEALSLSLLVFTPSVTAVVVGRPMLQTASVFFGPTFGGNGVGRDREPPPPSIGSDHHHHRETPAQRNETKQTPSRLTTKARPARPFSSFGRSGFFGEIGRCCYWI